MGTSVYKYISLGHQGCASIQSRLCITLRIITHCLYPYASSSIGIAVMATENVMHHLIL